MKNTIELALALQSYDEGLKNLETAIWDDMFDGKLSHGNLYLKQTKTNNPNKKITLYDISQPLMQKKEYATTEQVNLQLDATGRYVVEVPVEYGFRLLKSGKLELFKYSSQEPTYVMDW